MIGKVAVIGAGVMGTGISQVLAEHHIDVILVDLEQAILEQALTTIRQNIRLNMLMGKMNRDLDLDVLFSFIHMTTSLNDIQNVDFVIENTTEKWTTKARIYPEIDDICPPDCIFAANTSAISITRLADLTRRADKVLGMHFMNPVPQKPIVETIRGKHTSDTTIDRAASFLAQINKRHIVVNDAPGFVANRISHLYINEAIRVVQEKIGSAEQVDAIFRQCYNHETGPLETADLIGLDTVLLTLEALYQSLADPKFRPAPLLQQMVDAGLYGRKSGQGFYKYYESPRV
ncbi:3-hydroxyacyl-CoA dehydrogenase family protein [Prodigiosinella aquatilis]|nr:3-hydroxyacyl-CoA dehydrogenase family protein [Prodigiosinella sp. LS101]WJV52518.1 3-hydroxyacyl-CoA dehydrogenase family protein [Prodigiosinella sp. LS101]WJV56872.1 3-hydroxyacyl-CoA dehydrogenase family protein [Pectobacteriaceae bacterium C111]